MLVAQRKPNFNMLRLIGAVQNQKKNELGHWVLVTDGHPSIQAYQVGHPSPSRLYFTYREKHLKENLYAPHWQS